MHSSLIDAHRRASGIRSSDYLASRQPNVLGIERYASLAVAYRNLAGAYGGESCAPGRLRHTFVSSIASTVRVACRATRSYMLMPNPSERGAPTHFPRPVSPSLRSLVFLTPQRHLPVCAQTRLRAISDHCGALLSTIVSVAGTVDRGVQAIRSDDRFNRAKMCSTHDRHMWQVRTASGVMKYIVFYRLASWPEPSALCGPKCVRCRSVSVCISRSQCLHVHEAGNASPSVPPSAPTHLNAQSIPAAPIVALAPLCAANNMFDMEIRAATALVAQRLVRPDRPARTGLHSVQYRRKAARSA